MISTSQIINSNIAEIRKPVSPAGIITKFTSGVTKRSMAKNVIRAEIVFVINHKIFTQKSHLSEFDQAVFLFVQVMLNWQKVLS